MNWIVSVLGTLGSGLPYSPTSVEQLDLPDREFKNSARKPLRWKVDFKAKKFFKLGSMIFALFINVDNLFDNLNEMTVYSTTGRASLSPAESTWKTTLPTEPKTTLSVPGVPLYALQHMKT